MGVPLSLTSPTAAECQALAPAYSLIPVYRDLLADMLTPVRAYRLLCPPASTGFLLESVAGTERIARYSFVGFAPRPFILPDGDPLTSLRTFTSLPVAPVPALPNFYGGLVGYLGYEAARYFEKLPIAPSLPPPLPLNFFLVAESLAIFDHLNGTLKLLTIHRPLSEDYSDATARLDSMTVALAQDAPLPLLHSTPNGTSWESNFTPQQFRIAVEAARDAIFAGDAYQVVLSQRFAKPLTAHPFDLYRCLRTINPSPYMFFLALGENRYVVGASPEKLVSVVGSVIETRPLAGTRRRGLSDAEDVALEQELRRDLKEKAEHIMLVDLGRNDLGRVSRLGSVHVERLMDVERYSHVMHLSSTVTGVLREDCDALDVLRAAFPAGTVSGAPKIRAMELIASLEGAQRGVYAGALGYIGFGGHLDMAITLRTIVVAEGIAYIQAGAGIVAASNPIQEYQETLQKASALFAAVNMAEGLPV